MSSRPPPRIDGMVSLKVDNITYRTTLEDLRRVFERCGEVGDIYIPRDRLTRESRGFAFVRYYDERDAEDALNELNGRMLNGREIRVQMARYGRPNSPFRSPYRRTYSPLRRSYTRSRSHGSSTTSSNTSKSTKSLYSISSKSSSRSHSHSSHNSDKRLKSTCSSRS